MTGVPLQPEARGFVTAAFAGAFAGLLLMALVLAVFVGIGASHSAALAQGTEPQVSTMVAFGLNAVLVVLTIGWIFALPVAFLLVGMMVLGERFSRPVFASLPAWLLGGFVATAPLGWMASTFDGSVRIDQPGPAHIVFGCGLVASAVAWFVRYRPFAKVATA